MWLCDMVKRLLGRDRSDAWDAAPGALGSLGRAGRGMSAAGHQGTPPVGAAGTSHQHG